MNPPRWLALLALSMAGLLPFAAAGPSSPESALVRIDEDSLALLTPDLRSGLSAVARLQNAWLAVMPEENARRLAGTCPGLQILDTDPASKAYFLVRVRSGGDWPILERLGRTSRLDEVTALFWSGNREAREILPPEFEIARVFLDTADLLRGAGEAAAIPRIPAATGASDPAISQWVSQVSPVRLASTISDLEGFRTRYASTEACESAGEHLYEAFHALGLWTEYDPFPFGGYTSRNIVATLRGRTQPTQQVILCGHYDSTSDQRWTLAPGADDNGSGTAAVLEIARILAGGAFDYTIKFICFSAEEWGLYGSRHYVTKAQEAGETILGVLNMDMIAYTDEWPWLLNLIHNDPSAELARRFAAAAWEYAGLAVHTLSMTSFPYSDHSPFWDAGYAALCACESARVANPYTHTTADRLGTLAMGYLEQGVRAVLAAAAELAQPAVVPAAPTGLAARSQLSRSLFIQAKTVALRWDANRDEVVGYCVYRATVPGGPYQRLNSVPQADLEFLDRFLSAKTTYYYAVTAVNAGGRESDLSLEVADSEAAGEGWPAGAGGPNS